SRRSGQLRAIFGSLGWSEPLPTSDDQAACPRSQQWEIDLSHRRRSPARRSAVHLEVAELSFLSTPQLATPQTPPSPSPQHARRPPQRVDRSYQGRWGPIPSKVSCAPPAPGRELTNPA